VSAIPRNLVPEDEYQELEKRGRRAYLSYDTNDSGMLVPIKLSKVMPKEGCFIRGHTNWNRRAEHISMRYGVEKFFTQQGKGLSLERGVFLKSVRLPLEMKVAVGETNGIAVLCGYRYSDLGMGVTLVRGEGRNNDRLVKLTIKIVNASDHPLAIVDPINHSTFRFELSSTLTGSAGEIRFNRPIASLNHFQDEDIRVISPKSLHEFDIDLLHPSYQLIRDGEPIKWEEMTWGETARIVYDTPNPQMVEGLKGVELLWQGMLYSRSFTGRNFVD
ncbi:MAG: GDYXXLXY domain-containing protein, partial [Desulfobacterales bacterium]|nr:GDYXXLXY domain-containing protein [Desulfobacterales bacterium]